MWYFVEKNGRCISKHKVLPSARLRAYIELMKGVEPSTLEINDAKGNVYPLPSTYVNND